MLFDIDIARPAAGTDGGGAHGDAQGVGGGALCTAKEAAGPDQVPDAIARAVSEETLLASVIGGLEHRRFSTNSLVTTL